MIRLRWNELPGVLAVALLLGVPASPASAQRAPARPGMGPGNREQLEERIRARFGEMVKQRLGLNDEQAHQLNETVRTFQGDRMDLFRDEQALRKRVEALMLEGASDQAEAKELLDQMAALRVREAQLSASEQDKLLTFLSPVQVLQFQAMREEMGRRIQRLRGGPGGPPGGDGEGRGPGMGRRPGGDGGAPDSPALLGDLLVPER